MSTLSVTTITGADTIKSGTASTPPTIQDSNGTQVGTFCRAWVNFNGTGTVAIRASFNVTSITDNNTGDYTVNFTNALSDANYSAIVSSKQTATYVSASTGYAGKPSDLATNSVRITTAADHTSSGTLTDNALINVAIFR